MSPWIEPRPWSQDVIAWKDMKMQDIRALSEDNFWKDDSAKEVIMYELWETCNELSSMGYHSDEYEGEIDATTVAEIAYLICRHPDPFFYSTTSSEIYSFIQKNIENIRLKCDPNTALAWAFFLFKSYSGNMSMKDSRLGYLTWDEWFDIACKVDLGLDEIQRYAKNAKHSDVFRPEIIKNDIDGRLFESLSQEIHL